MIYLFNPHRHVKIWLSKNPDVFMNVENQIRLVDMRRQNPKDIIHFVYDSTLLNEQAQQKLATFCEKHQLTPVDIHAIDRSALTKEENRLLNYYDDEVKYLKAGGNLAVASDILRWISPVYTLGSYTDFDVPIDTTALPETLAVESPILLNIGSLKIGANELILSNNDFIGVVDPIAGAEQIKNVQNHILSVLDHYQTDFIETATAALGADHFLYTRFSGYMKGRAEAEYMRKSEQLNRRHQKTSRELRSFIHEVTSNTQQYLEFSRLTKTETDAEVIARLRAQLQAQLGFIKWFFFHKEYQSIQKALRQSDEKFIAYCMRRERSLYLKSIVVCTTGPIAIARALFGNYVLNTVAFNHSVTKASIHHYGLEKCFRSQNTIQLHENILGMLKFLGTAEGELNDSSWLEEGEKLQKSREHVLFEALQHDLYQLKKTTEQRLDALENPYFGLSLLRKNQIQADQAALKKLLACFNTEHASVDLEQLLTLTFDSAEQCTSKTAKIMKTALRLQAKLKQFEAIDLTSLPQTPFVTHQEKRCFAIQPQRDFHLHMKGHTYRIIRKVTAWQTFINICMFPIRLIFWAASFILVRLLRELVLSPSQIKQQRTIHHIAMENTADDFVIVDLTPKVSFKRLKDRFFKLGEMLGFNHSHHHVIHLHDHQKHLDALAREIHQLRAGTSKAKRCEGQAFPWHKIRFKGLERLDPEARDYFLQKIRYDKVEAGTQTPHLEFFTLNTQDGAVLDSMSISTTVSQTPIAEKKFVINCIEREQNAINWVKDATKVSEKTGATVILFNYRGIDQSRGVIWTQDNLVTDIVAQAERLIALGAQPQNITIEGNCLGGAIATIAAAHMHQRGYPVKLYNLRSFQSIERFLAGYFMPTPESSKSVLAYVKYAMAKMIAALISPILDFGGWSLNAKAAWDTIPHKDKNYGVICTAENPKHASPQALDGIIHHGYASIAGHMEQKREHLLKKRQHGQSLTQEEHNIASDQPSNHYFRVGQDAKADDNEVRRAKIQQFGRYNHFAPRSSLRSTMMNDSTCYDHLARMMPV